MDARDPNELDRIVNSMTVRSVNITFSAKVTRKEFDDFRSFESSHSWTMRHEDYDALTPEVAKLATLRYSPHVISKVFTDLYIGGVVSLDETKQRIREMKDYYRRLYDAMLQGGISDTRASDSDLSGAGDPGSPIEAGPAVGAAVPAGVPDGVPEEAGSYIRTPRPSEP